MLVLGVSAYWALLDPRDQGEDSHEAIHGLGEEHQLYLDCHRDVVFDS